MYDLSGLYYQMIVTGSAFGVVGLIFLICSRFWNSQKKNKKDLIIGIVSCILCVCTLGYYAYNISNAEISVYEGSFVEEHRENPYLLRMEYCFSNGEEIKPLFYLDVISKKKVYNADFEKNAKYRIYYEEQTDTIVKVEKID